MPAFLKPKILIITSAIILFIVFSIIIIAESINKKNPKKPINQPTQPLSPTKKKELLIVKGSIPYWDQDNAFESFQKNIYDFDYINLFWYFLTNSGEIKKYEYAKEDENLIDFAHQNNVKVMAVITNLSEIEGSTWDSKRVERVIKDRATRAKHISDILAKLELLNFDGVNIDYEEVNASYKDKFSLFIKELTDILHKKGKIVAVSLHPKREDEKESIGAFQDWKTLAENSDQLSIMAYNEHWDESAAGPIASFAWVKKIIEYTQKLNLPTEKLFLGIPLYGYDWNKDDENKAKGLTYKDVEHLIENYDIKEKWDSYSRSPYFFYYDENGDKHEVWFENARSAKEKVQLAKRYGLSGITFWRLGSEDSSIWNLLD